jgi:hypothetical protein
VQIPGRCKLGCMQNVATELHAHARARHWHNPKAACRLAIAGSTGGHQPSTHVYIHCIQLPAGAPCMCRLMAMGGVVQLLQSCAAGLVPASVAPP